MRQLQITQSITHADSTLLENYFGEIGKIELLRQEEEVMLAQKIRAGDKEALDRLVRTNLRFVVSIAKKYQHNGLPLSDLISEGNLGLIHAAKKFDETRGFKFISFAVWWIRQSILLALSEQVRLIRLPQNHINLLVKVNREAEVLECSLGRLPTDEELGEHCTLPAVKVSDVAFFAGRTVSYDIPTGPDENYTMLDNLASNEDSYEFVKTEARQRTLTVLLGRLSENESQVIKFSYGLNGSRELSALAIADEIGMSEASVLHIRKRALKKLRVEPAALGLFG